jgi:hypothetical protein
MRGEGEGSELWGIAPPQQHTKRSLPLTAISWRLRKPLSQESQRSADLIPAVALFVERRVDQLTLDSPSQQHPSDSLAPPPLELSLVLRKHARVPAIVEVARFDQFLEHSGDHPGIDLAPGQVPVHFPNRALASAQVAVGKLERSSACLAARQLAPRPPAQRASRRSGRLRAIGGR